MTENGTPVSKEKTVAFSGHRTNRIAKFTADREKLFREVAFDTFVAIESYCIKKGYDTILAQADEVVTLQDGYTEGCFLRRNDYLLENSAFLMVYYDTVAIGGTFYTLKRAVEQKKKFANVCYNRR